MSHPLPESAATGRTVPAPPSARWWRRHRRLLLLSAGFVLAIYFAPAVVAHTSLCNRLARAAAAGLNGTLTVGSASLGWFAPVELRNVTLTDPRGRPVLVVPRVVTRRTLVGLLWDRTEWGEVVAEAPAVEIVCSPEGTNAEEVFRGLIQTPSVSGTARPAVTLRVTGGRLILRDATTDRSGEWGDLEATVRVPARRDEPVTVELNGSAPGRFTAELSLGDTNRLRLVAEGVAWENLSPLLGRWIPGLTAAGSGTAELTASWDRHAACIEGTVAATDLRLSGPVLHGDTLYLTAARLPLRLTVSGSTLRVERAELTSDLATATFRGSLDTSGSWEQLLDQPDLRLDATIDLARLAGCLPRLLHVREGTEFRGGSLTVTVEGRVTDQGTAWSGRLTTSALRAVRYGREIVWDSPVSVEFAARVRPDEWPHIERLICRSEFLAVNARLGPEMVRAAANVHLDKLAARLADFVNLAGRTLDGQAHVWLTADRQPGGEFRAEGGIDVQGFILGWGDQSGWGEPELKGRLTAAGVWPDAGPPSVQSGRAVLIAAADELHITLSEPVPDVWQPRTGRLDVRLSGELARWRNRLVPLIPALADYRIAGVATGRGTIQLDDDGVRVTGLSLEVDGPRFQGAGLNLAEPKLTAAADVRMDRRSGSVSFDGLRLRSPPLSVADGQLVIESPPEGVMVVSGQGTCVTDLNRLGLTTGLFTVADGSQSLHGRGSGPFRFRRVAGVTTFALAWDVTDFALGRRAAPDWTEPALRLEAEGSYARPTDTLTITTARWERPGLAVTVSGTLGQFATTTEADLTGTIRYDLARLTPRLRQWLGEPVAATGRDTRPVSLRGSLTPPARPGRPSNPYAAVTAHLSLGWDSARLYGFELGPGELRVRLADGVARANPVTATFGGGRVVLQPTAVLDPPPGVLTFAPGRAVDRARLTPEALATALGYAVPAFAKANRVEGEVSLVVGDNRIPLADPRHATAQGTLILHRATATPGPVVAVVARLLGADSPTLTLTLANEQAVPVRVDHGRVFHDKLTLKLGGSTVATSGSVGFDGSLDLMVEVPVPGTLPGLKHAPLVAKALTGKRVAVPIRGTLDQPALDPQAFRAAVVKLAQEAARDVGRDWLQRELEKVFPGSPLPLPPPASRPGGWLRPLLPPKK